MAYEFTKQKLATERTALRIRLAITAAASCAGLALGLVVNDVNSFVGLLSASAVAVAAGVAAFYLAG